MKFSIITPVKNTAQYLEQTIHSIRNQSWENWEQIIVDGQSTDGSLEIARRHAAEDSRISVLSEADNGIYDAIFRGFSRARGDWVSWLNADDLYTPWAFATIAHYVGAHPCDWLTGYAGCWDDASRLRFVRPGALFPRSFIKKGYYHEKGLGCLQQESMFFKRSLIESLDTEDKDMICTMRLAGDFYLWRCFAEQTSLHVAPTVLGGFRLHGQNLSSTHREKYQQEVDNAGGRKPPLFLRSVIMRLFHAYGAYVSLRKSQQADFELHQEISATPPAPPQSPGEKSTAS